MQKVNLTDKFALFSESWTPKIVAELNGQYVKLAKLKGEFDWHSHDNEDELFLVVKGRLTLLFEDGSVDLGEGDLFVVPRGVRHKPVATEEAHVLLMEPVTTAHTGALVTEKTVAIEDQTWI